MRRWLRRSKRNNTPTKKLATTELWLSVQCLTLPSHPSRDGIQRVIKPFPAMLAGRHEAIDEGFVLSGDRHIERREVVLKLLHRARPENDGADDGIGQGPGEGEL